MQSTIKDLSDVLIDTPVPADRSWQAKVVQSDQCISYVAWNEKAREAAVVDPKREDWQSYLRIAADLAGYRWIAVIDTHTHADHVSCAAKLAEKLGAPVVMHCAAPTKRAHLHVCRDTVLSTAAGPLRIQLTPGHTADSITPIWGPFLFGGDTIVYGDSGRDDLPTGSPNDHYDSIQAVKAIARPELILLPGHDPKGGRASSWAIQLKVNASLKQDRETFLSEAHAFNVDAPHFFKESLVENFK